MVTRLLVLALFTSLPSFALGTMPVHASLDVSLSSHRVELGKPVVLTIKSTAAQPLQEMDLSGLEEQFHIHEERSVDRNPSSRQQVLTVKLFSYRTGHVSIPVLHFADKSSRQLNLTVTEPIDPKTRRPIAYHVDATEQTIWLRQQLVIATHLTTDSAYSQFRVATFNDPLLQVESFRSLPVSSDSHRFAYRVGWTLVPIKPGNMTLRPPPIQFYSDGVPTHSFYHPPIKVTVKPLPVYVPGTMPVGQLWTSTQKRWLFVTSEKLSGYDMDIYAKGIPASRLPAITAILKSTDGLHIYPEKATLTPYDHPTGPALHATYRVPYKALSQGLFNQPAIKLDYFDPHSATIKTLMLPLPTIISVNRWVVYLASVTLFLFLVIWLYFLVRFLVRRLQFFIEYKRLLHHLTTADSAHGIRLILASLAKLEVGSNNPTLRQSFDYLFQSSGASHPAYADLSAQLYSPDKPAFDSATTTMLLDLCYQKHPTLRWLG